MLWSRRPERARELAGFLGALGGKGTRVRALAAPEEALAGCEVVLLCLPDAVIAPFASRLARSLPARRTQIRAVLHTNGFLGAQALEALKKKGVAVGKLHPLWAASRAHPILVDKVSFGIGGDPRAVRAARELVRWMGGRPVVLGKGSGPEYHAAASLLSGGLVALFELSDRLLARAVPALGPRRRYLALNMLAHSSLSNVFRSGTQSALTGALSRGAEETVRAHLRALRRDPDALAAYQVLGRTMLELARARGSVDSGTHRRLARLIRAPRRKR